jgi:endo-1,4-beta-xylanase
MASSGFLILTIAVCLAACEAAHPPASPTFTLVPSPSPSPFQPATASFTPLPSLTFTPSPTSTSTATEYQSPPGGDTLRSLADAVGFGIGTPYLNPEIRDPAFLPTLTSEFNTVMLTTFMKKTQPESDRFDWSLADAVVQPALESGMRIQGGPLVYNNETAPAWLGFTSADCGAWTPEALEGILKDYIRTVISHFENRVSVWEVVNEPITSGNNCWRRILGDAYIGRAFLYAHESDPAAVLMLNEAFGWTGVDRDLTDQFLALVRSLKDAGVPLDAVGIQMHLNAEVLRPSYPEEFQYFLAEARKMGVRVMITEMDVYQGPPGYFADPFEIQKQVFNTIARICLEDPYCTDLTVWGVSDRYTWLLRIEGSPYPDPQPLLFDSGFLRKPAYFGVLDALREALRENWR